MQTNSETSKMDGESVSPKDLIASAYSGLEGFSQRMRELETAIEALEKSGEDAAKTACRKLKRQIRDFEPSVTMIGQVKAGKTTLVNALTGMPSLLPADINPWTSVVTSLHLDPGLRHETGKAKFRFFTEEEWDRLMSKGGRVGELASRAGADKELEKVRVQLEEMREKSRQRLGKKFELLMGQEHEYGYVDEELVQRYVCLGDEQDDHSGIESQQGRFADITKSADLYLLQPDLPHRFCLRDTPGVNDTFMIREQITVNAIRQSRLCVVVLSAHQALSTVDMALIRLISNIRSREVIIFVNRIDELNDPVRETEEIRESITATLKAHDGPTDAQIVFGSAFWATSALKGTFEQLGEASSKALLQWAEHNVQASDKASSVIETIWRMSGIPALCEAITSRIENGEGAEFEERIIRSMRNIASGIEASRQVDAKRAKGEKVKPVAREDISRELDELVARNTYQLDLEINKLLASFESRLDGARRSFLTRATASLISHLENYGDREVWNYDPVGLRLLLRSSYQVFSVKAIKVKEKAFAKAVDELRTLYLGAFDLADDVATLEAPVVPNPPPPVILGSTIALDVKGSWWTGWWRRRRSYQKFAEEYAQLVDAEIAPIVNSLRAEHADTYADVVRGMLKEFFDGQRASLLDLAARTEVEAENKKEREASPQKDGLNDTVIFLDNLKPRTDWRATS